MREVDLKRAPGAKRAEPLDGRLAIHQHPADVGMDEQRIRLFLRVFGSGQRTALTAILCVLDGVLIGDIGLTEPLNADAEARRVHHHEHRGEALILLADHPSLRAIVVHDTGRIGMDAHLVLDRAARERVALAERAVVVDDELGDDEERDALDAVGRIGSFREDEVDDIVGQVMLARRDEDFRARHRIAAVAIGHRAGTDQAKVGAAVRFGQVHRPAPFARYHPGDIGRLLLVRPLDEDRRGRALRQPGVHGERLIGGVAIFLDRETDHVRQSLSAEFFGCGEQTPARFAIRLIRFLEALRRRHRPVVVARAAFEVARLVDREQHFLAELPRLGQHRLDHVGGRVGEAGQVGIALDSEHVVKEEQRILHGCAIDGHGVSF